jgi:hypothetical protein
MRFMVTLSISDVVTAISGRIPILACAMAVAFSRYLGGDPAQQLGFSPAI